MYRNIYNKHYYNYLDKNLYLQPIFHSVYNHDIPQKMMHTKIFLAPGTSYYSKYITYETAWYFLYIFSEKQKSTGFSNCDDRSSM